MPSWRIYYYDNTSYSSADGPPEGSPGVGVACIAQRNTATGLLEILHGDGPRVVDWFWWEDGCWLCGDLGGLIQHLDSPGWKKPLAGRNMPNAAFRDTMRRAASEPLP